MNGKSGTMTPEDFELLTNMATTYSPFLLGLKVAKVASRISASYLHEYPESLVGSAWKTVGERIVAALNTTRSSIVDMQTFNDIYGLVTKYGAELVIRKLAKIAGRSGAEPGVLKTLFPVRAA